MTPAERDAVVVPVEAKHLRLWRDTLRGEQVAVAEGEEPFLHDALWGGDVPLSERMIASMEAYLIAAGADWPDGQE